MHFVIKTNPKLSLLKKNCYQDGNKWIIKCYACITNIILTSVENEANFYQISVFGVYFVLKNKFLQAHIMLEKSENHQPLIEN